MPDVHKTCIFQLPTVGELATEESVFVWRTIVIIKLHELKLCHSNIMIKLQTTPSWPVLQTVFWEDNLINYSHVHEHARA